MRVSKQEFTHHDVKTIIHAVHHRLRAHVGRVREIDQGCAGRCAALRNTSDAAGADIDRRAEAVEDKGEAVGGATEQQAESNADAMRERADAVRDRGERQADAVEAGTMGAKTKTDTTTTTTAPDPK